MEHVGHRLGVGHRSVERGGRPRDRGATTATPDIPAAASNGAKALLAWTDTRNGFFNADIHGSFSPSTNFAISQNFAVQSAPAAASNGTDFFVAWYDARTNAGVYGTRVRASDGAPLDDVTTGIQVSSASAAVAPRASFDGSSYVVVCTTTRGLSMSFGCAPVTALSSTAPRRAPASP
ncbi:MAG: hypothetical protein M3O50_09255 [Myxococcota bacterium]|nr:hypothetical protein [Myxococcota bacterium]